MNPLLLNSKKNQSNLIAKKENAFWPIAASLLKKGEHVFLALVADHTRHSPGTAGAKLMVAKNMDPVGTVGGGIMEYELLKRAHDILDKGSFQPEIQTLIHQKSSPGDKSGMICAGKQTNLYILCRPEKDSHTVMKIAKLIEKDKPAVLTINSSGLQVRECPPGTTQPSIRLSNEKSGWRYDEQLLNFNRTAIIGGGHCSLALSRVMKNLGYEVFVYDVRENVFTVKENVYATSIRTVEDYRDAGPLVTYPELTNVIVMTTDVKSDVRGLLGVLTSPFPFIGVMGSQAKIAEIFRQLKKTGISEDQLSRLTAPAGIPIGSNTPEEIAISVAAQILQQRNSSPE